MLTASYCDHPLSSSPLHLRSALYFKEPPSTMIPTSSKDQRRDYPRTTLALSYAVLAMWLIVGMLAFNYVESPDQTLTQPHLNSSFDGDDDVEIESLILDLAGPNRSIIPKQQAYIVENANIISIETFTNETSTFLEIKFTEQEKQKSASRQTASSTGNEARWDLVGSMFFSMTVVTTIGYGNLAPATNLGKFCCFIYAIVGIPLCFNVVSLIRKSVLRIARRIHSRIFKVSRRRHSLTATTTTTTTATNSSSNNNSEPFHTENNSPSENNEEKSKELKLKRKTWIVTCFAAMAVFYLFVILGTTIIYVVEGWEFFTTLYYSFITLTTIGFGDVIAGQNLQRFDNFLLFGLYRAFLSFFIFIGMAFSSLMIHEAEVVAERLINKAVHLICVRSSSRSSSDSADNKEPFKGNADDVFDQSPSETPRIQLQNTPIKTLHLQNK